MIKIRKYYSLMKKNWIYFRPFLSYEKWLLFYAPSQMTIKLVVIYADPLFSLCRMQQQWAKQPSKWITSANLTGRASRKVISCLWFTCITKRQPSGEERKGGISKGEKNMLQWVTQIVWSIWTMLELTFSHTCLIYFFFLQMCAFPCLFCPIDEFWFCFAFLKS